MEKTKLLIVDDHPDNILVLSELLTSEDVEIFSAQSAEEALNLLLANDFGLALLDVQMPGITGFELARLARGVKKTRHLPMIFVTAQQHDKAVAFEGYETGAVDFLFKPLDPHIVRSKVRTFVQLDKQRRLLKAHVAEVETLKKKAEMASLAKSQFLANMSHEIRTPLGSVLGFADVLSQGQLDEEEKKECLAAIRRNGELLLRLVDDILDISKIEAQKLDFEKKEFGLRDLLEDIHTILNFKATEKGINLQIHIPQENIQVIADPMRIKQVLLNVVGNAIKFTNKGSVKVHTALVTPVGAENDRGFIKVVFVVEDTGLGLAPHEAQRLFQPFTQADISTTRKFGGTGLGLVISRQLARLMGGDLRLVSSEVGIGSTFEITLHLKHLGEVQPDTTVSKTQIAPNIDLDPSDLHLRKILVVDDVSDNRLLIDRYLRSLNVQLLQASSGLEAIEAVEEYQPDLILMDIQMPVMDGYEAVRRIREKGFSNPIFALTAHAMREEKQKCLLAGCDLVLTKPVRRNELIQLIKERLPDRSMANINTMMSHHNRNISDKTNFAN